MLIIKLATCKLSVKLVFCGGFCPLLDNDNNYGKDCSWSTVGVKQERHGALLLTHKHATEREIKNQIQEIIYLHWEKPGQIMF